MAELPPRVLFSPRQSERLPLLPTDSGRRGRTCGDGRQACRSPPDRGSLPWGLRAPALLRQVGMDLLTQQWGPCPVAKQSHTKDGTVSHSGCLGAVRRGRQTGTRPGYRPCNSRRASALRENDPFFAFTKGSMCLAALILIFQNGNWGVYAYVYLLLNIHIYKDYVYITEKVQIILRPEFSP